MELTEVDSLAKQLFEESARAKELQKIADEQSKIVEKLKAKMVQTLKDANLESFKSNYGSVSISLRTSVRIPQTVEDKLKLFDYLKEKNIFNELVSVNSMTLNSFYKTQLEEAMNKGDMDWKLPGVGEPVITESLYMRGS